jgi:hypothetical protein
MGGVRKVVLGWLAMALVGCGEADVSGESGPPPHENVGKIKSSLEEGGGGRPAGSIAVTMNGQLQLWVIVCERTTLKMHHRIRIGTGNWGSWVNDNLPCSAAPSLAPWRSRGNELPTAYYLNGKNLMETTWRANGDLTTVNLSTHIAGLGDMLLDPVVSYFDVAAGKVSVLAWRRADSSKFTSLDFYNGAWHMRHYPLPANVSFSHITPFFSENTGSVRHFITGGLTPAGTGNFAYYRKTTDAGSWLKIWTFNDLPNMLTFGGGDSDSCLTGCLTYMSSDRRGKWSPIGNYDTSQWNEIFLAMSVTTTPLGRPGGDLTDNFAPGEEVPTQIIDLGWNVLAGTNTPGVPLSVPLPVSNVHAGSIYERVAFFTLGDPESFPRNLYEVYSFGGFPVRPAY